MMNLKRQVIIPLILIAAAIDERPFDVEIEPLFPQQGQECVRF